jgi:LysR family hydrogen peroxide-inducible transcriptional activator
MSETRPLPYTLRQLQYAIAVYETLNFGRAALRCHVSQPSLSAQVAELEEALGVPLFERNRRRVLPTAAGREVLERARRVLLEADDLALAAQRLGDPLAGTLRLGVIPTLSPYLLPLVAPALRRTHPKLATAWVEDKTEILIRTLDAGDLDGALLALEAELGDVEREVVGRDHFVLATPPGHPLGAVTKPATNADLRDENVLLLDEGHCLREQALAVCTRAKASELEFRATSLPTLVQMVSAGAGVTLLPELSLATEARRGRLKVRPFVEPRPYRTVALVWRRRSPLGAALKKVAETIRCAYPKPRA